jgi:hypothetical protein
VRLSEFLHGLYGFSATIWTEAILVWIVAFGRSKIRVLLPIMLLPGVSRSHDCLPKGRLTDICSGAHVCFVTDQLNQCMSSGWARGRRLTTLRRG